MQSVLTLLVEVDDEIVSQDLIYLLFDDDDIDDEHDHDEVDEVDDDDDELYIVQIHQYNQIHIMLSYDHDLKILVFEILKHVDEVIDDIDMIVDEVDVIDINDEVDDEVDERFIAYLVDEQQYEYYDV